MKERIIVGLLYGGVSTEHEVSLVSASNIIDGLDREKYIVLPVGIDPEGNWYLQREEDLKRAAKDKIFQKTGIKILPAPGEVKGSFVSLKDCKKKIDIDVIFPAFHGSYGEDGKIQGLCKVMKIPFVGSGVLGSAVSMDKEITKRLFKERGIPQCKFISYRNFKNIDYFTIADELGIPFFIKPANSGSSVGISKVYRKEQFQPAVDRAFLFDFKIIFEEYVKGREIECSVLGNENPIASLPGEVISRHDFYSYNAKYIDDEGASLSIPAKLEKNIIEEIQNLAIKAFKTLSCEGMARVDFFLREDNIILVNEVNTIPGFTNISMYPKLWEISGIPFDELLDKLITYAIERFASEANLQTKISK